MFANFPQETTYAYPFANLLSKDEAAAIFSTQIPQSWQSPLALYIHVPYCIHLCHFCGFVREKLENRSTVNIFVESILVELELHAARLGNRRLSAVYFGGGTASVLSIDDVSRIFEYISKNFTVDPMAEITFEGECLTLIRPGYLKSLAALGFGRLSFGVQIMDQGARSVLNLRPCHNDLRSLAENAMDLFPEVNIDYIYGWPSQSPQAVYADINLLVETVPSNSIELFAFEVLDADPKFIKSILSAGARLLEAQELQQIRNSAVSALRSAGYKQYGYTLFKRGHAQNSTYSYSSCYYGWSDAGVLGVGRGAQSFVEGLMWGNALSSNQYVDTLARGEIPIAALGTYERHERERVTWPRRGWISSDSDQHLGELERYGYIRIEHDKYVLTNEGEDWVPAIIDHLMPIKQQKLKKYSTQARRQLFEHEVSSLDELYNLRGSSK